MASSETVSALRLQTYENAVVVPTPDDIVYRNIIAGAFDENLEPIPQSYLTRSWHPPEISFPPDVSELPNDLPVVEEPHIYGGYFFGHFGHFLLESLSRTWATKEVGSLPFVWASGGPPRTWQTDLLKAAGIEGPHLFPEGPVRFRRLIVPDAGFRIQHEFHPSLANYLGRVTSPEERGDKVWLSRTKISEVHRRTYREGALQQALAEKGWRIVHPQELSVPEQLDLIAGAGIVAGLEGSAFHLVMLHERLMTPLVLLRRSETANYRTIADRKGLFQFDLYGAYRMWHQEDRALKDPLDTAKELEALANQVLALRERGDLSVLVRMIDVENERRSLSAWQAQQGNRPFLKTYLDGRAKARALFHRGRHAIERIRRTESSR